MLEQVVSLENQGLVVQKTGGCWLEVREIEMAEWREVGGLIMHGYKIAFEVGTKGYNSVIRPVLINDAEVWNVRIKEKELTQSNGDVNVSMIVGSFA